MTTPTARESEDPNMAQTATATRSSLDLHEPETPAELVVQPVPVPRVQVLPAAAPDPKPAYTATPFASSDDISQLIAALASAQGEFERVLKSEEAKVASRREGASSYSYGYATLADVLRAVRSHLSAAGIAIIQAPITGQSSVRVITFIGHSSGQWMRNELALSIQSTDAQSVGSAITYARRYALMSLLGVAPEDDDDGADATKTRRPEGDAPVRPGQGPVTMPQRAQPTSPQSGASASAQPQASSHAPVATTTAAAPDPAPASFVIEAIEPRKKKDNTPYWVVAFSHGVVACTFRKNFADQLEEARKRQLRYVDAVITKKGDWLFLDSLEPAGGAQ